MNNTQFKYDEWDQSFLNYFKNKKCKLKRDLIILQRLGILKQNKESRILELFCGKAECQELLIDNGYSSVFGSDLSYTLLRERRGDCRIKVCDGVKLAYKTGIFDVVFINEGLHHLRSYDEIRLCFEEIKRVLREGGSFIFYEPANTVFRRIASLIIFSPFANISQRMKLVRDILSREMSEYGYWLRNNPRILQLLESCGFMIERNAKDLIHMAVVSRLINKSI